MRSPFVMLGLLIVLAGLIPSGSRLRAEDSKPAVLPRLVDLGAGKCIPCKQMKPILDELARDYADQFETVFIDVWEKREEGEKYGVRMIPTQIFYDAAGRERFRHTGFYAKKDILAKWRELGVALKEPAPAAR